MQEKVLRFNINNCDVDVPYNSETTGRDLYDSIMRELLRVVPGNRPTMFSQVTLEDCNIVANGEFISATQKLPEEVTQLSLVILWERVNKRLGTNYGSETNPSYIVNSTSGNNPKKLNISAPKHHKLDGRENNIATCILPWLSNPGINVAW